jgi:hypothetical protein
VEEGFSSQFFFPGIPSELRGAGDTRSLAGGYTMTHVTTDTPHSTCRNPTTWYCSLFPGLTQEGSPIYSFIREDTTVKHAVGKGREILSVVVEFLSSRLYRYDTTVSRQGKKLREDTTGDIPD